MFAGTEYSLNDRLLLSAVVHLTMKTTLKELHIRIPSPPRKAILAKAIEKKPAKKIKCPSPYLEPYTFKPEPRKHSGMYENTHRQYPESPYFSYLAELVSCVCLFRSKTQLLLCFRFSNLNLSTRILIY